tara:strand:- start:90 stop:677 length:588 start_codon:yes stop_codon:yes gene_type:complete
MEMNDKEYNLKCEELRELNLPDEIDFLYIGESRPIERDHFFYLPYKPEKNTPPLITIFEKIYTNKTILDEDRFKCSTWGKFLELFKSNNCYLYDVCDSPVNDLESPKELKRRKEICLDGENKLTNFLKTEKPKYILVFIKGIDNVIEDIVERSIKNSGIQLIEFKQSVFPRWKRDKKRFEEDLSDFLVKCLKHQS